MTTFARGERAGAADALARVGADAPTLCEGWAARDLAAHLVLRERRPDAAAGILAGFTARAQRRLAAQPYDQLLDKVRTGPPRWSPYALPGVDEAANTVEMFVHHEDVRRAQSGWEPRELSAAEQQALWRRLVRVAKVATRSVPYGVLLRRPTGEEVLARDATPRVTVTGPPAELLLFALGRQDHARVEVAGDDAAVAAVREASIGL